MKFSLRRSLLLLNFLLLGGCGYHLLTQSSNPHTVSVPFIDNDTGGELTRALIKKLSQSEQYRPSGCGRYTLEVSILSNKDENVGFRYDQNREGDFLNTVIPAETRTALLVEVSLIDTVKGCLAFGPARLSASHTFDHDWYVSLDRVNVFSLGQVTDYDDAKDGVYHPLTQKLAQKIVDLLDAATISS
jgi:hypothetical protein